MTIFTLGPMVALVDTLLYDRMEKAGLLIDDGSDNTIAVWRTYIEPTILTRPEIFEGLRWLGNNLYHPEPDKAWELYDLSNDIEESNNVAEANPKILAKMTTFARAAHRPVRPGAFLDPARERHERDRWAKWGTSGEDPRRNDSVGVVNW